MYQSYRIKNINGICIYKDENIKVPGKGRKVKVIKNKLKIKSMGK